MKREKIYSICLLFSSFLLHFFNIKNKLCAKHRMIQTTTKTTVNFFFHFTDKKWRKQQQQQKIISIKEGCSLNTIIFQANWNVVVSKDVPNGRSSLSGYAPRKTIVNRLSVTVVWFIGFRSLFLSLWLFPFFSSWIFLSQ